MSDEYTFYESVVLGAGPAGLSASLELAKENHKTLVLERHPHDVGGLAKTVKHNGFLIDLGGHRFYTKQKRVQKFWEDVLSPKDLLTRNRVSRIYYKGQFYNYPLNLKEGLFKLGLLNCFLIVCSLVKTRFFPLKKIESFEDWAINRFGCHLYNLFFKSYTEKVWGRKASAISRDWAEQRIQNLSLFKALISKFFKAAETKSLITSFQYPRKGPGMMWEACRDLSVAKGAEIKLGANINKAQYLSQESQWEIEFEVNGNTQAVRCKNLISTIPMTKLVLLLHSQEEVPTAIQKTIENLAYRNMIVVAVMYEDQNKSFKDNWVYIHESDLKVGRIQNYKRWSEEMVPSMEYACIGLEYFCNDEDEIWNESDEALLTLAKKELNTLKFIKDDLEIIDFKVIKVPKAYPVYCLNYQDKISQITQYLKVSFPNLYLSGRNGMHRYNNQDHSIMTSLIITDKILYQSQCNEWNVNVNAEYLEESP